MTTIRLLLVTTALLFLKEANSVYYRPSLEVLKPIVKPAAVKPCTVALITKQPFKTNPFVATFNPPSTCGQSWSLAVLKWSATVVAAAGNAAPIYTATIFFGGVTVLKTITAPTGPYFSEAGAEVYDNATWNFETDVTQFTANLKKNQSVNVHLKTLSAGNGVLTLTLSVLLYAGAKPALYADSVLPLAKVTGTTVSPFTLRNGSNSVTVTLSNLPRNIYRAQVQITQLPSGLDQEYWRNYPQQLLNLLPAAERSKYTSGGIFRETLVHIDGLLAGATWQFPILVAGSINPFILRPVVGIGSFILPSYTVDITPFVGRLVDGKNHSIKLQVVNPVTGGFWDVSGSLHLWLDKGSKQTSGTLISRKISDIVTPSISVRVNKTQLWGKLYYSLTAITRAQRAINITGTVSTSFGSFSAVVTGGRSIDNVNQQDASQLLDTQGVVLRTKQTVSGSDRVSLVFRNGTKFLTLSQAFNFPLSVHQRVGGLFGPFGAFGSLSHGFNVDTSTQSGKSSARTQSLRNQQQGHSGTYRYQRDNGSNQTFVYRSNFQGCYSRNYSQFLEVFSYDKTSVVC